MQKEISLEDFIHESLKNRSQNDWMVLNSVSYKEAKRIFDATGLDVFGYERIIDSSSIIHSIKEHGNESRKDQISLKPEDLLLIPEISIHYDRVIRSGKNNKGLQVILFEKRFEDKYYYLEEIRTRRKKLSLTTMYIKRTPRP